MARKFRFRPSPREQQLGFAAAAEFMASAAPDYKRDSAQDRAEEIRAAVPPAPKRRPVHEALDIDAIHKGQRAQPLESEVVHAVSQLLAVHPKVLIAVRQNSGMASYEAKTGRYAPVYFYKLLRPAVKMTITDFWGVLRDGSMFALEAKRLGWTKPRNDREEAQAAFLAMVRESGGIGAFVRSSAEAQAALEA